MAKNFPTDEKLIFLLCDAIRQELGGKLSLLGVFSGGQILSTEDAPLNMATLAVYYMFQDGEGEFKARLQVEKPNGSNVLDSEIPDVKKEANINHILKLTINNVVFDEYGDYKFRVILDKRAYERIVKIDKGTPEQIKRFL